MSAKVFVLDDDPNSCKLAERILTEAGYQVLTRTSPIGATVAISAFQPALVLLDVNMPALQGDTVIHILNQHMQPRPKILLYSSKSSHELRDLMDRTQVEGFVCKTEGNAALVASVKRILPQPT